MLATITVGRYDIRVDILTILSTHPTIRWVITFLYLD